jgi:hypothetical protein
MRALLTRAAMTFAALALFVGVAAAQDGAAARATALDALRASPEGRGLPPTASFTSGDRTIDAGSTVSGPVAIMDGTAHVRGIVNGSVWAYHGSIVVHTGGEVRGDAVALSGKVTLDGGRVTGDVRSLDGDLAPVGTPVVPVSPQAATTRALLLSAAWLGVLIVVGIGVLVFASTNMDAVSDALERDFGRAFLAGIVGEIALLPVLGLVCLGLVLTVLGILLIPFAVVAYVLAAAGLVTIGYLALARVAGRSLARTGDATERDRRAGSLKAMLIGLVLAMSPWFLAGGMAWNPTASLILRTVAVAVTWVAATAGLGAALVSRGGVKRAAAPAAQRAMASASWQTPTPVAGVVAARRPTPYSTTAPK